MVSGVDCSCPDQIPTPGGKNRLAQEDIDSKMSAWNLDLIRFASAHDLPFPHF